MERGPQHAKALIGRVDVGVQHSMTVHLVDDQIVEAAHPAIGIEQPIKTASIVSEKFVSDRSHPVCPEVVVRLREQFLCRDKVGE